MTTTRIDDALLDPELLGAGLGDPGTWSTWLGVLRAAFGLKLNRKDRRAFETVSRRKPPTQRVRELWAIVGRRSGKSRIAALLAVFFACFVPHTLAAGEIGTVLVLAASKDQARVVFNYAAGFLQTSPVLAHEVEETTVDEIRLRNGVVIAIHAASFRTVRGRTLLAAIFDEAAYWRDDTSSNPDVEIYRSILPALSTTNGMLIGISTGYRKIGLLYQKHREHFGVNDPDVLVVGGSSEQFNPTINSSIIAQARADDPEVALAEWDGGFRSDIAGLLMMRRLTRQLIMADRSNWHPAVGFRILRSPIRQGVVTMRLRSAVGHRENDLFVADVIRGRGAPFDPQSVTDEFAKLLKQYRVSEVVTDHYAAEWAAAAWRDAGIKQAQSELNKSELYVEGLPEFMRGAVRIPHHSRLLRELRLLERRASRAGRDLVDHGRNGSDDFANALFGAIRFGNGPSPKRKMGERSVTVRLITWNNNGPRQRSWHRGPVVSAVDGKPVEKPQFTPTALHQN